MNAPADPTTAPGPESTPSELFAPIPAPLADGPAGRVPTHGAADVLWYPSTPDPEPALAAHGESVGSWPRRPARRPLVAGMAAAAGLILALGGAFGVGHVVGSSGSDGVEISDAGGGAEGDTVQSSVAQASTGGQASTGTDQAGASASTVGQVAPLPVSDDESS